MFDLIMVIVIFIYNDDIFFTNYKVMYLSIQVLSSFAELHFSRN